MKTKGGTMMKKILIAAMLFSLPFFISFTVPSYATQAEYDSGYRYGYNDGINNRPTKWFDHSNRPLDFIEGYYAGEADGYHEYLQRTYGRHY